MALEPKFVRAFVHLLNITQPVLSSLLNRNDYSKGMSLCASDLGRAP
jgi:hypothetical protein